MNELGLPGFGHSLAKVYESFKFTNMSKTFPLFQGKSIHCCDSTVCSFTYLSGISACSGISVCSGFGSQNFCKAGMLEFPIL